MWTLAAVVAVQLGAQLAPKWRPIGFQVALQSVLAARLVAQEAQVERKRRPGGSKMSPKGAQEAPS